jgi:Mn2+/Fe2+ NRAMP family transporter
MRSTLVIVAVAVILLGGAAMGFASLLLLPLIGGIALIALIVWFLQRRSAGKPPLR